MSFRYTLITEFLYGSDLEQRAILERAREAFGPNCHLAEGYIHGRFGSVDDTTPREWFDAADIGVAFAVVTEDGNVWVRKRSATP